jgi:type II secretory pathway component PulF
MDIVYNGAMSTLALPPTAPVPQVARRSPGRAVFTAVCIFGLLTFPLVVIAIIVPKFEEIFKDFGVALPVVTRVIINVGHAMRSPLGVVIIGLWLVGSAALAGLISLRSAGAAGILLLVGMLLAGISFIVLILSMFAPLVQMIESLQQGGAV